MIDKPGFYDLPEDQYHADPCPEPSLSSSIAKLLISDSPRHAWWAHPRLNPYFKPNHSDIFDLGRAAHQYFLEGSASFVVVDAKDWRTNAAKEARADARAAGKAAILPHQMADIEAMAKALRAQLDLIDIDPFANGTPEKAMVWQTDDIWYRARLDWQPDDPAAPVLYDYKTTGGSANPDRWSRTAFDNSLHVQEAMYCAGWEILTGNPIDMRFIVQENKPPYAASICAMTPEARDLGRKQLARAIEMWAFCRETDTWPGYPAHVCWLNPPPWVEAEWLNRENRDQLAGKPSKDALEFAMDWQRPRESA